MEGGSTPGSAVSGLERFGKDIAFALPLLDGDRGHFSGPGQVGRGSRQRLPVSMPPSHVSHGGDAAVAEGAAHRPSRLFGWLRWRRVHAVWEDPFGQVVDALEIAAFADHQLAGVEQTFQCYLAWLPPLPPRPSLSRLHLLEIRGQQRSFFANAPANVSDRAAILLHPVPGATAAGDGTHAAHVVAIIGHGDVRGGVGPVFEDATVVGQQLVQHPGIVVGLAAPEGVFVGPMDNGDGVDLHVTEAFDGLGGTLRPGSGVPAPIESLAAQGDPPSVVSCNRVSAPPLSRPSFLGQAVQHGHFYPPVPAPALCGGVGGDGPVVSVSDNMHLPVGNEMYLSEVVRICSARSIPNLRFSFRLPVLYAQGGGEKEEGLPGVHDSWPASFNRTAF